MSDLNQEKKSKGLNINIAYLLIIPSIIMFIYYDNKYSTEKKEESIKICEQHGIKYFKEEFPYLRVNEDHKVILDPKTGNCLLFDKNGKLITEIGSWWIKEEIEKQNSIDQERIRKESLFEK